METQQGAAGAMPDDGGPYFLGVGAQKAGTTWLHEQLALHPQVALPERKEVHYFDMVCPPAEAPTSFGNFYMKRIREHVGRLRNGSDRPDEEVERIDSLLDVVSLSYKGPQGYRDYLQKYVSDETKIVGEITPAYSILDERGFAHIRETLGCPKIVFIMRDPFDRYWSLVRMAATDHDDLQNRFISSIDLPGLWRRGDYRVTIQMLDRFFHQDDVLYLFYEELFQEGTLKELAQFLDIDEVWSWDIGRRSNVGQSASLPPRKREVMDKLAPVYEFVRSRFGDRVPNSWSA